jgi:hypothetical protein
LVLAVVVEQLIPEQTEQALQAVMAGTVLRHQFQELLPFMLAVGVVGQLVEELLVRVAQAAVETLVRLVETIPALMEPLILEVEQVDQAISLHLLQAAQAALAS